MCQVPEPYRSIFTATGANGTGGMVAHAADRTVVSLEDTQHLTGLVVKLAQPQIRTTLQDIDVGIICSRR